MTIYQVNYYNNYGEKVANLGYYINKIDAEERAFDVRINASLHSGNVGVKDVFVHSSSNNETEDMSLTDNDDLKV